VTANAGEEGRPRIDTTVPHSARIWNYWLGGKDNYPVDRQVGEQTIAVLPEIVDIARASRAFLVRVVRYLAADAGIRQFLDIGTGLPTADNTHQVAQQVAPESRVVYVDNDPLVLVHARALLTSSPEGTTDYIEADARDVGTILHGAGATLDFTHSTSEVTGERVIEAVRQWNQVAPPPTGCAARSRSRRLLRRPGADRARSGALPAVAAGTARHRPRKGHGRVLRPRPQMSRPDELFSPL
jgi:hypothetical protein